MDNYLSSRWPKGPGIQPPPVPERIPAAPPKEKTKWSLRRWAVSILCVVLCLALLPTISLAQKWLPTQQSFPLYPKGNRRTRITDAVIYKIQTQPRCFTH